MSCEKTKMKTESGWFERRRNEIIRRRFVIIKTRDGVFPMGIRTWERLFGWLCLTEWLAWHWHRVRSWQVVICCCFLLASFLRHHSNGEILPAQLLALLVWLPLGFDVLGIPYQISLGNKSSWMRMWIAPSAKSAALLLCHAKERQIIICTTTLQFLSFIQGALCVIIAVCSQYSSVPQPVESGCVHFSWIHFIPYFLLYWNYRKDEKYEWRKGKTFSPFFARFSSYITSQSEL